jgi:hypothetical protein
MSSYSALLPALGSLNMTPASLQGCGRLFQEALASNEAGEAVRAWAEACRGNPTSALLLLYVANEAIQTTFRRDRTYAELFLPLLPPAMQVAVAESRRPGGKPALREKARNVAKTLGDRGIYPKAAVVRILSESDRDEPLEWPDEAPPLPLSEPVRYSPPASSLKISPSLFAAASAPAAAASAAPASSRPKKRARANFDIDMAGAYAPPSLSSASSVAQAKAHPADKLARALGKHTQAERE